MKIRMKIIRLILVIMMLCGFAFPALAKASEGTATRAIQDLDDKLDDYRTGQNLTEADRKHNKQIKEDILHGTFDILELSRLALDKHWVTLKFEDRKCFVDLMTSLLENKAILSKEQGQKKAKTSQVYNVNYIGEKFLNKDQTRAQTATKVYVKSEDISVKLDYKLRKKDNTWKIYDVVLDGASLVDNYKYQFDSIIKKHGYPELVRRMEKKLDEIKKDNGKDDKDKL